MDDIPVAVALQESEVMFYNSDIEEATIYGASRLLSCVEIEEM